MGGSKQLCLGSHLVFGLPAPGVSHFTTFDHCCPPEGCTFLGEMAEATVVFDEPRGHESLHSPHWLRRPQPLSALTPFPAWTKAARDPHKGQWLMPSLPPFWVPAELRLTLHARRSKVLPREEDGMIMVLIVTCVRLLLEVSPTADILQALGGVPNLNEAHGLQGWAGKMEAKD